MQNEKMALEIASLKSELRGLQKQIAAQSKLVEAMMRGHHMMARTLPSQVDEALKGLTPYDLAAVKGDLPDISHERAVSALQIVLPILVRHEVITRPELAKQCRGRHILSAPEIDAALALIAREGQLEVTKTGGGYGKGRPTETLRFLPKKNDEEKQGNSVAS